jgi:hypothetical protein
MNVQMAVLPKSEDIAKVLVVANYEDQFAKAREFLSQMGIKDIKPLIKVKNGKRNKRRMGKTGP